jgi:hypothetical protein
MQQISNLRHAQLLRSSSAPYRATYEPSSSNTDDDSSSMKNTVDDTNNSATLLITAQLKEELADILSDSPVGKCLEDESFIAVIDHAVSKTKESVELLRTLPPPTVTAEIIESIIKEATQETTEYANAMAATSYEIPADKLKIQLNTKTLDSLRRDVRARDLDRGQFFSVLHGLLSNYIKRECVDSCNRSSNNSSTSSSRSKKKLHHGQRLQQLSELVLKAVRQDSLTDALVAVKALLCHCGSGVESTRRSTNALQQSAVDALVHLGERFIPDVSTLRRQVKRTWNRHHTLSWQSDPTLTFAWQGPSRTTCELRRIDKTHCYVLKGSNFVARGTGMCTSGMGHLYYEVTIKSPLTSKGLRVGWGSNSRVLAPETYSNWNHGPNEM